MNDKFPATRRDSPAGYHAHNPEHGEAYWREGVTMWKPLPRSSEFPFYIGKESTYLGISIWDIYDLHNRAHIQRRYGFNYPRFIVIGMKYFDSFSSPPRQIAKCLVFHSAHSQRLTPSRLMQFIRGKPGAATPLLLPPFHGSCPLQDCVMELPSAAYPATH